MKVLYDLGVNILVGTDSKALRTGCFLEWDLHREMGLPSGSGHETDG